jgi:hypothetical protein
MNMACMVRVNDSEIFLPTQKTTFLLQGVLIDTNQAQPDERAHRKAQRD